MSKSMQSVADDEWRSSDLQDEADDSLDVLFFHPVPCAENSEHGPSVCGRGSAASHGQKDGHDVRADWQDVGCGALPISWNRCHNGNSRLERPQHVDPDSDVSYMALRGSTGRV